MLNTQEINILLKNNFQQQLSEIKDLPEDLAEGYKLWIRNIAKKASQQLAAEAHPQQQENEGGQQR